MKKFVVFILGFISGAAALLLVSLIIESCSADSTRIPGLTLLEQPGEVMESTSYRVFQVVENGHALAMADLGLTDELALYLGTVVLFLADENANYYDDQIIDVPRGKCARQVGTYQYETEESYKTVPVVQFYDK